jgi:5-deoxy-D-glucuronate isomerase
MADPINKYTCVKNIWMRQMHFLKAGDANDGHSHTHDHCTLLAYGKVKVHVDGNATEFSAPHTIYIQAGKTHYIEALEDNTVAYCIHGVRDKDTAELLDADQIPFGIDPMVTCNVEPLTRQQIIAKVDSTDVV